MAVAVKTHSLFPVTATHRYTHLISVEYFNDLMDVFRQMLRFPALPLYERLRCLLSAADILKGQGEALSVDRRDFHALLYDALLQVGEQSSTVCQ